MTQSRAEFVAEILQRHQKERLRKRKADRQEYVSYQNQIFSRTTQQRKTLRRTSF